MYDTPVIRTKPTAKVNKNVSETQIKTEVGLKRMITFKPTKQSFLRRWRRFEMDDYFEADQNTYLRHRPGDRAVD